MTQRIDFPLLTYVGNVANPVNVQDVATKNYVDSKLNGIVALDDINPVVNVNGVAYVGDKSVAQYTSGILGQFNAFTSDANAILTLGTVSLPNFTSGRYVVLDTVTGQAVVGVYAQGTGATQATIINLITDRSNGFTPSQTYTFVRVAQLKAVNSSSYFDNGNGNFKFPASQLGAGTNVTITADPSNAQRAIISASSGGGSGGVTIQVIDFVASATPSAGQNFTSNLLTAYTSADFMSVSVNGSTLHRSNYTLTGTVLTISGYLPASANVQVQPSASGGSSQLTWNVGGNALIQDAGFLGASNANTVNLGTAGVPSLAFNQRFVANSFTVNVGVSSNSIFYMEDVVTRKVFVNNQSYDAPISSNTFSLRWSHASGEVVTDVAQISATETVAVYSTALGAFSLAYILATSNVVLASIGQIVTASSVYLSTILGVDVVANGQTIVVSGTSGNPADANYIFWTTYSKGTTATINFPNSTDNRIQVATTAILDILADNVLNNIVWVVTTDGLYKVDIVAKSSILVVSGTFTTSGSLCQIGQTIFIFTNTTIYSVVTNATTPVLKTINTYPTINYASFTADTHTPSSPRVWAIVRPSSNTVTIDAFASTNYTEVRTPIYLGNASTPTFTTPLLAGDSAVPTTFSAGNLGQVLNSGGANASPYWASLVRYVESKTLSQNISGGSNTNLTWNLTSPDTNFITYDNSGTFSNVSGRTIYVSLSMQIPFRVGAGSNLEVDFWVIGNNYRVGQWNAFNLSASEGGFSQFTVNFASPASTTFSLNAYVSSGSMTVGTGVSPVPFGSQTFLSLLMF